MGLQESWMPERDWLEEQYLRKGSSKIARECGRAPSHVLYWLKKFEIQLRSKSVAHQLARSNHVSLSGEALEFLNGEILGDGHLTFNKFSSSYRHKTKHKSYLEWLSKKLENYGVNQSGRIVRRERVSFCKGKKFDYTSFNYCSLYYVELKALHSRWYREATKEERKRGRRFIKIVPSDLKLTPLTCMQWYIGDGCLHGSGWDGLSFSTQGFENKYVDLLVNLLRDLGFKVSKRPSSEIYAWARSTKAFLDFIGPCPEELKDIYGYKWNGWRYAECLHGN